MGAPIVVSAPRRFFGKTTGRRQLAPLESRRMRAGRWAGSGLDPGDNDLGALPDLPEHMDLACSARQYGDDTLSLLRGTSREHPLGLVSIGTSR